MNAKECRRKIDQFAEELNVPSKEFNDFLQIAQAMNKFKSVVKNMSIVVPPDVAKTSWELVGSAYKGTHVERVFKKESISNNFGAHALLLAKRVNSIVSYSVISFKTPMLEFVFSDGSPYTCSDFKLAPNVLVVF